MDGGWIKIGNGISELKNLKTMQFVITDNNNIGVDGAKAIGEGLQELKLL